MKPCPKCGRPMAEETMFDGVWTCPGYVKPLNDKPPFRYQCDGIDMTMAGAQAIEDYLMRPYEKPMKN